MSRPLLLMMVGTLLFYALASAIDEDPVEKKLTAAKEEFEKATEKARAGLLADLQKKEEAAQKAGDLKTLEKVQAEAKAFEESNELPKSVLTKGYENQMRAARAKLVEAYTATVKQYTMEGKIAQAKAVQQELDEFKKGNGLAAGIAAEKWVPLFNGRDLRGWKQHPESTGKWNVENGAIVGRGPDQSHLFTEGGDYVDFHLRVQAKINAAGNSGVCFRTIFFGRGRLQGNGYEANIEGDRSRRLQTGSLMHITPKGEVVQPLIKPGEWFEMEVIAVGNQITVKVNGKVTIDVTDPDHTYKRGHLALQQLGDKTEVYFRKIEVKLLPPAR